MQILYGLLGAFCVLVSMCGLLAERLKIWQYICLAVYITLMGIWELKNERIIGVLMLIGLFIFWSLMVRRNKLENLCLACLGYMFSLFLNNSSLRAVSFLFKISVSTIERKYYLLFAVSFCIILVFAIGGIRFLLYNKIRLFYYIDKMSVAIKYGLLSNLILYTVLFMINISWGERAGYNKNAIQFNGLLFVLCMIISNYLIIVCTRHVKSEEARNAEIKKQKLLEDYIICLENIVEETRAFKHDYKNMLSTMAGFMLENRVEELRAYFVQQLQRPAYSKLEEMQAWQYLKNVQPIEIKGMLFEKVLSALGKGIQVQVEISANVNIVYAGLGDLIRILGIFLDNAIEEVEQKKGTISVIIAKTDDRILFQIMNEYVSPPDISKIFCKGYSTKGDGRGLGLYLVQSLVHKHEDIAHECKIENGMFIQKLEILM